MSLPSVHLIAGARPNFMKVAPVWHELKRAGWCEPILLHTGQHYDAEMSEAFLRDLKLPTPDVQLGVGSGSHAKQTAAIMVAYEELCERRRPDWVVVVGDVNSTIACTLAAKKLNLPVAHLEAGLRSFDRTMPEEINRLLTDAIADLLWTPSADGDENLLSEGVAPERIERVGNVMIDSFEMLRPQIEADPTPAELELVGKAYGIVTLHRPANVDNPTSLERLVSALVTASRELLLVFPIHPRTRQRLENFGLMRRLEESPGIRLCRPLGYISFMSLVRGATLAITDSGGLQEETTYLGIPCLTLRETTERPVTVIEGTNQLVRVEALFERLSDVLAGGRPESRCPDLWDGRAAGRVAESLYRHMAVS